MVERFSYPFVVNAYHALVGAFPSFKSSRYSCIISGFNTVHSDDEVDYLLDNDIKRVKEELSDEYYWFGGLNEARQHAMIDMSFNLGQTRLRGFKKALDAMATEDYDRAADEFMDSRWAEQVKSRAPEVTEMIRTGEYQ